MPLRRRVRRRGRQPARAGMPPAPRSPVARACQRAYVARDVLGCPHMSWWVPRRRRTRVIIAVLAALLLSWLVACMLLVAVPSVNRPTKADAIIVLGSPTAENRLGTALQ